MVTALLKEKEDEIKHKDFCTDGLNKNERAQELKARDIDELEAKIADLTSQIDCLTKSIAQLQAEIAEAQTQLKRAGEDRPAPRNPRECAGTVRGNVRDTLWRQDCYRHFE